MQWKEAKSCFTIHGNSSGSTTRPPLIKSDGCGTEYLLHAFWAALVATVVIDTGGNVVEDALFFNGNTMRYNGIETTIGD